MSKFIKLRSGENDIYVNTSKIIYFAKAVPHSSSELFFDENFLRKNDGLFVDDTPEEILKLINEVNQ